MYAIYLVLFYLYIAPLSAQPDSIQTSTPMFSYNQYQLQISFENSYITYENHPLSNQTYFHQALEILIFDEDKREFHPESQRLMIPDEFILQPQALNLDSLDINVDTELDEAVTTPQLDTKKATYTSLNSNFGESSSLYILPKLKTKKCAIAAHNYMKQQAEYHLTKAITNKTWGTKKGLIWRAQLGKTRLDHYLVFGKQYNYLFVSSPYSGANGVIETIIEKMNIATD